MKNTLIDKLIDFIDNSTSMFHANKNVAEILNRNGFKELNLGLPWKLEQGDKYYVSMNDSAIIGFIINSTNIEEEGFRLVGTHTDFPGFKVKPNANMRGNSYVKLNTEIYGGPILNTWLDRPLSLAGRVSIKSSDILNPINHLVDFRNPILVIPNLAIHMNREQNNGVKLNPQKETLPILAYVKETLESDLLIELISEELNINKDDILSFDLYLYPTEKGQIIGLKKQFISASRLDNLSMTFSAIHGIINSKSNKGISILVCFDNEEVGSRTKQGAYSPFLVNCLEKICLGLNKTREMFLQSLYYSFMISADVAHLLHPNYPEKSDPTNKILAGNGIAIKSAARFSYTTDSDSHAVMANLCKTNNIPYQTFVNRSDERGGSTIGPITSSYLGMRSVDIGTPILSMHSARELMACEDFIHTCNVLLAFYNI
ncbi:MAG: M18 family aminopeptidase [Candidatus Epulonipiscium fishelsonii]|nr:MAG: M18 family aminopeptidase [Epulopiscium sp. AS2M-Bin002]